MKRHTVIEEKPEEGLLFFKRLTIGKQFTLDAYPGNTYAKLNDQPVWNVEFVVNRHSAKYKGCKLTFSPMQLVRVEAPPVDWEAMLDTTNPEDMLA